MAGLNASSRFDHYREFKTALNEEMYLDCIKQKCFRDFLVRIRLGISNLKVQKNRYARSDVPQDKDCPLCARMQDKDCPLCPGMQDKDCPLCPGMQDKDCPLCPGMQDNELQLFFVCKKYEKIRPNRQQNIEPHHEIASL